jgi:large subunit ribosomal protein L17
MLRNQAQALIRHERIETTVPRAKELRPFVERLITIAKRGLAADDGVRAVTARRLVARDIHDNEVVSKLFETVAPRFSARPGGYTRLLRLGYRRGDAAEVAQVELIGSEYDPNRTAEKPEGEKSKAKGVGGRLRAAADRLRGSRKDTKTESADAAEAAEAAQAKAAKAKRTTPRAKAKTGGGAKKGRSK